MMIPGEVAIHGNLIYKEYNLYQLYQASKYVRTHLRLYRTGITDSQEQVQTRWEVPNRH